MATGRSYFATPSYRFLPGERHTPVMTPDSRFELDESDVWSSNRSSSPEIRKPFRFVKKASKRIDPGGCAGATPSSLPMNVPDWSKILSKENRRENDCDFDDDDEDEYEFGGNEGGKRIPPHEYLARQMSRTRIASFSVHEGVGRTLKGRDLSRVRNAIWEKTGFQD